MDEHPVFTRRAAGSMPVAPTKYVLRWLIFRLSYNVVLKHNWIMQRTSNATIVSSILTGTTNLGYTPNWNKVSRSAGYPVVYCPDHPNAWSTGYIFCHRVVAEQNIGRLLLPTEIVHHLDEDKDNFHPDNLEVLQSQTEHAKRHSGHQTMVAGVCCECGQVFVRRKGNDRAMKFCGYRCNGKAQRRAQLENGTGPFKEVVIIHGSKVAYSYHRCRCDICREANTDRARKYRAERHNSGRSIPLVS